MGSGASSLSNYQVKTKSDLAQEKQQAVKDAGRLNHVLKLLGETVRGQEFETWQRAFIREHAATFDLEDENKLVYTDIHRSYQLGLEERFHAVMCLLQVTLDEFEAAAIRPSQDSNDMEEAAEEALRLVLERSDFEAFKAAVILERQLLHEEEELDFAKEAAKSALASALLAPLESNEDFRLGSLHELFSAARFDIDGIEGFADTGVKIIVPTDRTGWSSTVKEEWLKFEYGPSDDICGGAMRFRGAWLANLTADECRDMLLTYSDRRSMWDAHFKGSSLERGAHLDADDVVMTLKVDMGFFLHWAGLPQELCFRRIRRSNHPVPGATTVVALPWNAKSDCIDVGNWFLTWNVTVIQPHDTDTNKTLVTFFGKNCMGCLPSWVLRSALTVMPSRIAKGKNHKEEGTQKDENE
jgi:hypothetical protein